MRPNTKRLAAMSIAAAAVAAGAPTSAQAASNPDQADVKGIISSYLAPMGLRDDFNKFAAVSGITNKAQLDWLTVFVKFA